MLVARALREAKIPCGETPANCETLHELRSPIYPVNIARIRQRLTGGFRPFALRTSDGHEYSVAHPEFVLLGPHSLAVLDADGEIVTLDPLHIVAIKGLPAKKNGPREG